MMEGLDQEFIDNLDDEGMKNIIDTEKVINNIIGPGTNEYDKISNIVELINSNQDPVFRQQLLINLSDEEL